MSGFWWRADANLHANAKLRKARARAVWPWVLCRMRDGDGVATDDDLDPWRASDDLDGDLTEARAAESIEALKAVGLIVPVGPGAWTASDSSIFAKDPTAADRKRAQRERAKFGPVEDLEVSRDKAVLSTRHVTAVTSRDVTLQDKTRQDGTGRDPVAAVEVTTPRAPARNPGLRPHSTISSGEGRPERKLAGHPLADALMPMAQAAFDIIGACPEVFTLEAWHRHGWTLERVMYGLRSAKQSGQGLDSGKLIMSAQRWMQRARPEEWMGDVQAVPAYRAPAQEPSEPVSAEDIERLRRALD